MLLLGAASTFQNCNILQHYSYIHLLQEKRTAYCFRISSVLLMQDGSYLQAEKWVIPLVTVILISGMQAVTHITWTRSVMLTE